MPKTAYSLHLAFVLVNTISKVLLMKAVLIVYW